MSITMYYTVTSSLFNCAGSRLTFFHMSNMLREGFRVNILRESCISGWNRDVRLNNSIVHRKTDLSNLTENLSFL